MIATFFSALGMCLSLAQFRLRRISLLTLSAIDSKVTILAPVRGSVSETFLAATGTVINMPSNSGMLIPMVTSMGLIPCRLSCHSLRVLWVNIIFMTGTRSLFKKPRVSCGIISLSSDS
ncbi:hypothetical protein ES703_80780 [subsurface metagenome]